MITEELQKTYFKVYAPALGLFHYKAYSFYNNYDVRLILF